MPNLVDSQPLRETPAPTATPTRFIGRQPILDPARQVFGYELLFRAGWENSFSGDSETAAQKMIDNTLLFGMDKLVQGGMAFINCTRDSLTSRVVTCLPAATTVLEVLETVQVDDEVIAACSELKRLGYRIALDDFLPGTSSDRLIDLADYIKLDFRACDAAQLRSIQSQLRGSPVTLLAEKVETAAEFQRALDDGYHLFQGYFFAHPAVLTSREIPTNHLIYIRLLSALSRSPADHGEIERLVGAEASLCFRLLRLVNSAGFGIRSRISSIRQALLMVGEIEFGKLVSIAAASCLGGQPDQSPELILLCLHRARFCELLAPIAGQDSAEQYLIGLLSVLDVMLNVSMQQLLQLLPLRSAAADVLLGNPSPIDLPLRLVRHYERSDWELCAGFCSTLAISEAELASIYLESLDWANQNVQNSTP
jgi:c-di-GMP-related signal transduction protein